MSGENSLAGLLLFFFSGCLFPTSSCDSIESARPAPAGESDMVLQIVRSFAAFEIVESSSGSHGRGSYSASWLGRELRDGRREVGVGRFVMPPTGELGNKPLKGGDAMRRHAPRSPLRGAKQGVGFKCLDFKACMMEHISYYVSSLGHWHSALAVGTSLISSGSHLQPELWKTPPATLSPASAPEVHI